MTHSNALPLFRLGRLAPLMVLALAGCAGASSAPQAPEFTLGDMTIEEYCTFDAKPVNQPNESFRTSCAQGDSDADVGATSASTGIKDRIDAGTISALVFCDRDASVTISWQHSSGNVEKAIPCTDSPDGSYAVVATLDAEIRTDVTIVTPTNTSTVMFLMNDSISE